MRDFLSHCENLIKGLVTCESKRCLKEAGDLTARAFEPRKRRLVSLFPVFSALISVVSLSDNLKKIQRNKHTLP